MGSGWSDRFSVSPVVLWQVSGRNLQAPSYLYGTIHIQDGRVFSFDSTVWHCFDQCDALAVELLLDELNVSAVREKMMLPKGQTLNELFPKEDYRALDSLCKAKLGAGLIFFNRMYISILKSYYYIRNSLNSFIVSNNYNCCMVFLIYLFNNL